MPHSRRAASAATQNPGTAPSADEPVYLRHEDRRAGVPELSGRRRCGDGWFPGLCRHGGTSKVGTGNYMAMAATHYRTTPTSHLESGLPTTARRDRPVRTALAAPIAATAACRFRASSAARCRRSGLGLQSLSDGTSKVALVTESREESSHVVVQRLRLVRRRRLAAGRIAGRPCCIRRRRPAPFYWGCDGRAHVRYGPQQGRYQRRYDEVLPPDRRKRIRTAVRRHIAIGDRAAGTRAP